MTPDLATSAATTALRARPTVRLGADVEPAWREVLLPWARSRGLEVTESDATLAITTRPDHAGNATWVHSPFAGVEHLAPALRDDVLLTRTIGTMPQRIAEYVLTWVLADRWQTSRYVSDSASATWDPSSPPPPPERPEAFVVGTGAMGAAIARALSAVGHRVVGLNRSGHPTEGFDDVLPLTQLSEPSAARAAGSARATVLVLALPHTRYTAGLITPELLEGFDGTHLVNIGRGSVIRTDTLLSALDTGRVRRATLDVTEQEPLDQSSPLWRRPDVTITPHISGLTLPSDVVTSIDTALTEVRSGIVPASTVARDNGY